MTNYQTKQITSDILIIGGGTAGSYAAIKLAESDPNLKIVIAEKANIKRSGCLAAGVNALNCYITKGHVPEDYVEYAKNDANGIVRSDLLLSLCQRVNEVTADMEKRGLVILKDENGNYVSRGWRNLKINGENIKPILAEGVKQHKNIQVLNHVNVTDLKVQRWLSSDSVSKPQGNKKKLYSSAKSTKTGDFDIAQSPKVTGAFGFSVNEPIFYDFSAKVVLITTGGAAGLYKPNNPGFSRHKMWYPPFNTGAGYAMGILAGAEMTTFEMRFIALRCKDTIAPTGTIAQGVHAKQVNAKGEVYETKYGLKTSERCWGTVEENREGNGPCYLETKGISLDAEQDLYKAYLNMAPSQTLKWIENGKGPAEQNVEIEGTEPYIVGGHTASGFWIDDGRRTTLRGLYAAGDVAGGAPQKYVTGALAEGEIAAETIMQDMNEELGMRNEEGKSLSPASHFVAPTPHSPRGNAPKTPFTTYKHFLTNSSTELTIEQLEEAMQKVMDEYAGGIKTDYIYNEERLKIAKEKIADLYNTLQVLHAEDMDDLLRIYEIRERLIVCRVLIEHLLARKETRWHSFGENADFPNQSKDFEKYVNSVMDENGNVKIIFRNLK